MLKRATTWTSQGLPSFGGVEGWDTRGVRGLGETGRDRDASCCRLQASDVKIREDRIDSRRSSPPPVPRSVITLVYGKLHLTGPILCNGRGNDAGPVLWPWI